MPPGAGWRPGRLAVLGGALAGAFVGSVATRGVPFEREQVLGWTMAALVVVALGAPDRRARQVLVDWLPWLAVLVVYDYSRGLATAVGFPVRWQLPIRVDQALFGGTVPTVWLQERLIDPDRVHRWEVAVSLVYVSHFVVPFAVAAVLWVRDRSRWAAYVRRFVALSFLGAATFVVLPVAPPWLASLEGELAGEVHRTSARGWGVIGLDIAERVLAKGQAAVNLTAAVPSLHTAYAALVGVVLWPTLGRVGRAVVVAYAVAMGVVLVLGGEHYVVDVLVGWAYVALTVVLVGRAERWWRARRSPPAGADPQSSPSSSALRISSARSSKRSV